VCGIEAARPLCLAKPVIDADPEVVGFKLNRASSRGHDCHDLGLPFNAALLRSKVVVGKFVEFYGGGPGLIARGRSATIANMAREYGATCGFPVDEKPCAYLRLTGRPDDVVARSMRKQGARACGVGGGI